MTTRRSQRRRRVIYNVHNGGVADLPTRRQTEQLRRARKPTAAYGARVQRRLDARWYSMVPILRRTMSMVAGSFLAIAAVLTIAHAMTELWPWLHVREGLSRPLRIDRVDSLASYYCVMTWTITAAMALAVYQIRRYRLDDYRGQYRLWRSVFAASLLIGLHQMIGGIDWIGQMLETAVGARIGLSGSDWIRLILSMVASALMLRIIVDVRRSRLAFLAALGCSISAVFPETVRWHLWTIQSPLAWVAVTSAPVWTAACGCIAITAYLRHVYRDVLEIEDTLTLKIKLPSWPGRDKSEQEFSAESAPPKSTKPKVAAKRSSASKATAAAKTKVDSVDADQSAPDSLDSDSQESPPKPKKSWLGKFRFKSFRRSATEQVADPNLQRDSGRQDSRQQDNAPQDDDRPRPTKPEAVASESSSDVTDDDTSAPKKKRRFGLSRFRKDREQASGETDSQPTSPSDAEQSEPQAKAASPPTAQESPTADDFIDESDIDWDSLNKSERRRLRKQLKRQGRAA